MFREIEYGSKFMPMFTRSFSGDKTVLNLDKLNHRQEAELNGVEKFKEPPILKSEKI